MINKIREINLIWLKYTVATLYMIVIAVPGIVLYYISKALLGLSHFMIGNPNIARGLFRDFHLVDEEL